MRLPGILDHLWQIVKAALFDVVSPLSFHRLFPSHESYLKNLHFSLNPNLKATERKIQCRDKEWRLHKPRLTFPKTISYTFLRV